MTAKETLEHLFWNCPRVKAAWRKLVGHWTGDTTKQSQLESYITPSEMGERFRKWSTNRYGVAQRIWWAYCSIATDSLWILRNRATFQQESMSGAQSASEVWQAVIRQVRVALQQARNESPMSFIFNR
ncbi:hypothetical protein GQ600_6834 [Phytophthora cactorum]|nr:hypothetical protein GQ600_6834 [Phytophthora cactorum]